MKFIYFGNNYIDDSKFDFAQLEKLIQNQNLTVSDKNFIIYSPPNTKENEEIKKMEKIKNILERNSQSIISSVPNEEFLDGENFPIQISDLNTVAIIFDTSICEISEPEKVLVSDTKYKHLFADFLKEKKSLENLTIKDLIDWQFDKINNIVKSNQGKNNLVFITSKPLYDINANAHILNPYIASICEFYYQYDYTNIYWFSDSEKNNFEYGTITINMKNENSIKKIMELKQIGVGSIITQSNHNSKKEMEFESEYTGNKLIVEIEYISEIFGGISELNKNIFPNIIIYDDKNSLNKITYLENKPNKNNFKFNNKQKIYDDECTQKEKNKQKNKQKNYDECTQKEKNIFKKQIPDSDSDYDYDSDIDPYKIKYLKYKNKLFKLRTKKNV